MKTGIIQDDLFLEHDTGPYHPERKERLLSIREGINSYSHSSQLLGLSARPATEQELRLIHTPRHIEKMRLTSGRPYTQLDPDTVTSARSYEAALLAAGSVLVLIDSLF